jgi:hypothetical protein
VPNPGDGLAYSDETYILAGNILLGIFHVNSGSLFRGINADTGEKSLGILWIPRLPRNLRLYFWISMERHMDGIFVHGRDYRKKTLVDSGSAPTKCLTNCRSIGKLIITAYQPDDSTGTMSLAHARNSGTLIWKTHLNATLWSNYYTSSGIFSVQKSWTPKPYFVFYPGNDVDYMIYMMDAESGKIFKKFNVPYNVTGARLSFIFREGKSDDLVFFVTGFISTYAYKILYRLDYFGYLTFSGIFPESCSNDCYFSGDHGTPESLVNTENQFGIKDGKYFLDKVALYYLHPR